MKFKTSLLLFFLIITTSGYAQKDESVGAGLGKGFIGIFDSPIGYQATYDSKTKTLKNSFDINTIIVYFNLGYNYNGQWGSTMFIGIGAGAILQLQYGRNFQDNYNLIRIRTDLSPLIFQKVKYESKWRYFSVGAFGDYAFDSPIRDYTFGLTIGINLAAFVF